MAEAKEQIKIALELDPQSSTRMYQAARVANTNRHSEEALQWLERAINAGYQSFEVARDPEFANLRPTKIYQDLIKKGITHIAEIDRSVLYGC